jgi:hypothetical protein
MLEVEDGAATGVFDREIRGHDAGRVEPLGAPASQWSSPPWSPLLVGLLGSLEIRRWE